MKSVENWEWEFGVVHRRISSQSRDFEIIRLSGSDLSILCSHRFHFLLVHVQDQD
jgi:hypothetical protein